MRFNPAIFPTAIVAFALFFAGDWIFRRNHGPIRKSGVVLFGLILAAPSALMSLYYLHLFPEAPWYDAFRALPASELSAAGAGFFAGVMQNYVTGRRLYVATVFLTLVCFWISIPYLKPIIAPIPESPKNTWSQDVCIQSTPSTCGPASAATIFKSFGLDLTEQQIAWECFSSQGGTENWFLARTFRKRGFDVHYRLATGLPKDLALPAIAGVTMGCGHFVPILSETATTYVTGDPLVGRREYLKTSMEREFHFTGFFMEIRKRDGSALH